MIDGFMLKSKIAKI